MQEYRIKPYIILFLLFLVAIIVVQKTGQPGLTREPSIVSVLPQSIGQWTGHDILNCVNDKCRSSFLTRDLENTSLCPQCGSELDSLSLAEKNILPAGTVLRKKLYENVLGNSFFVSLVITGKERSGIHRPQWCLPGQGYRITGSRVVEIPVQTGSNVKVMLLDLTREDALQKEYSLYAYWFIGNKRETPHHRWRLFWTAYDGIFHGASQRWAYIAIMTRRKDQVANYEEELQRFISELYPVIHNTRVHTQSEKE